ncbi:hypothetical protein Tco_0202524 [Tanacetum coccineum]
MDLNLSQPSASTHVVAGMHKEALQPTSGPVSLGVTSKERANPQLSSVVSASSTKPVYSASFIIHYESASEHQQVLRLELILAYLFLRIQYLKPQGKPNLIVKGWKLSLLNLQQEREPAILKKRLRKNSTHLMIYPDLMIQTRKSS